MGKKSVKQCINVYWALEEYAHLFVVVFPITRWDIPLHSAKTCLHSCYYIETLRVWAANIYGAVFNQVKCFVVFFCTYPQDTQFLFHLGWMIIFSTIMDCSGPSLWSMSCSARTTLYVWNLDISKHNCWVLRKQTKSVWRFYQKPSSYVMQWAAVRTQLGAMSVPPQVGKKDSRETCHGQLYGRASSPFTTRTVLGW